MQDAFNTCSVHRLVQIFPHIWVSDMEQVYLSSYATKKAACPLCEKQVKESFNTLWEKTYPPSAHPHVLSA